MKLTDFEKNKLISLNETEYGRYSSFFNWAQTDDCFKAAAFRDEIIEKIEKIGAKFDFLGSKADTRFISRGCRLCGEGLWSCLFINGMCNANCFYCPSRQDSLLKPATNTFEFDNPKEYAQYINFFNFKGVSFSGGEPFITFDKLIKYLHAIRKECDSSIYTWVYSNGSLVDEEKLCQLKEEGLNEIRFDIGAFDYSLKKVELAANIIDTVTVEIPMTPDHYETIKSLVRPMKDAGVKHLNLHQLRVTPYNFPKMIERDYKFLHGRKVTVFNSEIMALSLLLHSLETDGVNVNYCSFIFFKDSFQSSATRKRYAKLSAKSYEHITENGYIRNVEVNDCDKSVKVTYFNPVASGKGFLNNDISEKYHVERKKMVSYKFLMEDFNAIYEFIDHFRFEITSTGRIIETLPVFDTSDKIVSLREFYEIFNFEIHRGGFADYF